MFRLVALVLLLQSAASAGQLRGRVVDAATKEPLARVQVRLEAKTIAAVTDAFGRFAIDDLVPGEYVLKVTTVGFLPLTQSITISDNTPEIEIAILPDTLRRKDSVEVRHPPRSGWLDELGRLKGGRSVVLGVAPCAP